MANTHLPALTFTLGALGILAAAACSEPTASGVARVGEPLDLGAAQSFAVLAGSTVTNTGATIVDGNLGVEPGLAVTGFPPGLVSGGTIHRGDDVRAGTFVTEVRRGGSHAARDRDAQC